MVRLTSAVAVLSLSMLCVGPARAHCEVPCGIYDDQMRIRMIAEHVSTIEKSMEQIVELSKARETNYNQLVRWINNKEAHATEVQHIVSQYFMTQRIKAVDAGDAANHAKYVAQLTLLHQMLVEAMKTKQTLDLQHVERLRSLLKAFSASYFGSEEKKHLEQHPH